MPSCITTQKTETKFAFLQLFTYNTYTIHNTIQITHVIHNSKQVSSRLAQWWIYTDTLLDKPGLVDQYTQYNPNQTEENSVPVCRDCLLLYTMSQLPGFTTCFVFLYSTLVFVLLWTLISIPMYLFYYNLYVVWNILYWSAQPSTVHDLASCCSRQCFILQR